MDGGDLFGYKDLNIKKIFKGSWNLKVFALTATIGILGIFLISFLVYPQLSQKSEPASAAVGWNDLGGGMGGTSGIVHVVGTYDGDIYAGGNFSVAGGVLASQIAVWNGSSWNAMGSGVDSGPESFVAGSDGLYVGGRFLTAGGVAVNNIARWDGSNWHAVGSGVEGEEKTVSALCASGDDIYAGGNFTNIGGVGANYIAKWYG